MGKSNYVGIDYGLGKANVDKETGVRYGVISQHSVGDAWYDQAEADYGDPHCPKCGNEVKERKTNPPYRCKPCKYSFDSDEAFGDEPIGWNYEGDGYILTTCLDTDIMYEEKEEHSSESKAEGL